MLINLPLEERQQYTSSPITRKQFFEIPRVTVAYHKYAIEYTPETISQFREEKRDFEGGYLQKIYDAVDSKGEVFTLKFKAPENISFFPKIVLNPEEAFDDAVDVEKQQSKSDPDDPPLDLNVRSFCSRDISIMVVCQYTVPKPGRYKAYLQAREAGDLHKFALVHAFTLNMEKEGPIMPQVTNQIYTNTLFNYQNFKLIQSDPSLNSIFPNIEIQKPEDGFITSFVFGADRQNVAVARMEVLNLPQSLFPSVNEWIFTKAFAEDNFFFLENNLKANGGDPVIKVKGSPSMDLECSLYDQKKKILSNTCKVIAAGDTYTFQFTIASPGVYGARMIRKEGTNKKILGYFRIER